MGRVPMKGILVMLVLVEAFGQRCMHIESFLECLVPRQIVGVTMMILMVMPRR